MFRIMSTFLVVFPGTGQQLSALPALLLLLPHLHRSQRLSGGRYMLLLLGCTKGFKGIFWERKGVREYRTGISRP
jgi:hypothetical protein